MKAYYCSHKPCGQILTEKAYDYSMKNYGKPLCYGHQRQTDIKNGKVVITR